MSCILGLSYVGCISSNKNHIFIAEEQDNQPVLTDASLLELSKEINNLAELREVAIKGLGIKNNKVDRHVNRLPSDISSATFDLLREWRYTQQNSKEAYAKLIKALHIAERPSYKQALAKD